MLANILYILSVILPVVTGWVVQSYNDLQARKLIEDGMKERSRMSLENTNTRAKSAEHEQALTNALVQIEAQASKLADLQNELAAHTRQISTLNDRE